jgi:hypothetical protein
MWNEGDFAFAKSEHKQACVASNSLIGALVQLLRSMSN